MAKLKAVKLVDNTEVINSEGKFNYEIIKEIPTSMIDTSSHNHDNLYPSKFAIEDHFTLIMDKVATITKSLSPRPLKTKGFLNGGYKSGTVHTGRIQRFNVVTETGMDIGTIGTTTSYYSPGASSLTKGYFFGNTSSNTNGKGRNVDVLDYLTETEDYLGEIMSHDVFSTLNNLYTQDKIYVCDNETNWSLLSVNTNTITKITDSQNGIGSGRQGLSSECFGYVIGSKSSTIFNYTNYVSSVGTSQSQNQQATGLSKDKDIGYWIDKSTSGNWKVNMLNNTVSGISCFTEGFGESNALGSDKEGFMMGGYDGAQHGKVQKMVWDTEAVSNVLGGTLVIPQSSAGMAEA